jgi:predicted RNase H-like HicB family nuclease
MESMKVAYGVAIEEMDGRFLVTYPDFPEAHAEATNFNAAFDAATHCLEETIAARIRKGEDIPAPSLILGCKVTPGPRITSKAILHKVLRETSETIASLAKKLGKDEAYVRELLDPDHATIPEDLSAAIGALGIQLSMAACSIRVGS